MRIYHRRCKMLLPRILIYGRKERNRQAQKEDNFNTNKGFLGSWRQASRTVKANNNQLFADVYFLGWLLQDKRAEKDLRVQSLLDKKLAEVLPILKGFCLWKLIDEFGQFSHAQVQKLIAPYYPKVNLEALTQIYKELARLDTDAVELGKKYYNLTLVLRDFLDTPNFETFHALLHWAHYSGLLLTGSTAKDAPVTEKFAKFLSYNPKISVLYTYLSPEVQDAVAPYSFLWEETEEQIERNKPEYKGTRFTETLQEYRDKGRRGKKKSAALDIVTKVLERQKKERKK
jgi:hypothetical protein